MRTKQGGSARSMRFPAWMSACTMCERCSISSAALMSYLSLITSGVRRAPLGIGQSLGIKELRPLVAKTVVMTERAGTLLNRESSRCHSTSSCSRTVRITKRGLD